VTIPATVPQRSEIAEGLMNYPVYYRTFTAVVFQTAVLFLIYSACSSYMFRRFGRTYWLSFGWLNFFGWMLKCYG